MFKLLIACLISLIATLAHAGYYCTVDDNKLMTSQGTVIYDYDNQPACREQLMLGTKGEFYCTVDDNKLMILTGAMIYDYENQDACREQLKNGTN